MVVECLCAGAAIRCDEVRKAKRAKRLSSYRLRMRIIFHILLLFGILFCCVQCSPFYTWGYAPTVHPDATTAYIYAVMARDRGDCRLAVSYYDKALALTWSDSVAAERDEAANCARQ